MVFGRLVVLRHDHWRTIDFDLGIHDQSIWLLSRFKDFVTVRGLPVFGHHATFAYFFLVPLAWLGAGPNVWNLLQVVAIATSAIPIYLLARDRLRNSWLATDAGGRVAAAAAAAVLRLGDLPPRGDGHPVPAVGLLGRRAGPVASSMVMVVVALSWKEDVALFVLMLGVLQLLRKRTRLGMLTIGLALIWFAVFALWMVPARGRRRHGVRPAVRQPRRHARRGGEDRLHRPRRGRRAPRRRTTPSATPAT